MILTVVLLLVMAAFAVAIAAAMGKAPLYVAVLLLCVVEAVQILPLR